MRVKILQQFVLESVTDLNWIDETLRAYAAAVTWTETLPVLLDPHQRHEQNSHACQLWINKNKKTKTYNKDSCAEKTFRSYWLKERNSPDSGFWVQRRTQFLRNTSKELPVTFQMSEEKSVRRILMKDIWHWQLFAVLLLPLRLENLRSLFREGEHKVSSLKGNRESLEMLCDLRKKLPRKNANVSPIGASRNSTVSGRVLRVPGCVMTLRCVAWTAAQKRTRFVRHAMSRQIPALVPFTPN